MTKSDGSLILAEFLPYRLSVLANRISRDLSRLYASEFGLSINEWRILAILGVYPGLSADRVCHRSEMDKVTVSRTVSRLRKRNLLSRRTDTGDRRRSVLNLTPQGTEIYRRIVPLAQSYERALLERLSAKSRRGLDEILTELDRITSS